MLVDEKIDERTLREIYLPHFEAAIKQAHAGTVMCSYNKVNGTYACENDHLIHQILEKRVGLPGLRARRLRRRPRAGPSLRGGLDFEPWPGIGVLARSRCAGARDGPGDRCPGRRARAPLPANAVRLRRASTAPAYADDDSRIAKAAHAQIARGIEESAITLLENRRRPLAAGAPKTIAVIGAAADDVHDRRRLGQCQAVRVFTIRSRRSGSARKGSTVVYDDGSDATRAAAVAKGADVAIVFAADYQSEGADRACLTLECPPVHGDQDGLIERHRSRPARTRSSCSRAGGPVLTPWRDRVGALLEAWYPGQEGGPAIARVLFGDADPGGRLPATFPRSEADLPTAGDPEAYPGVGETVAYKEGCWSAIASTTRRPRRRPTRSASGARTPASGSRG